MQFFCSYGQQAVGRYAVFLLHFLQFFCCYGQQAVERYAVFLLLREAGSGALPRAPLLCLLLDHMGLCLDLGLFCFRI